MSPNKPKKPNKANKPHNLHFVKIYDEKFETFHYAVVVFCSKCHREARIVPDREVTAAKIEKRRFICDECKKKLQ